jgi:hypothetical protein
MIKSVKYFPVVVVVSCFLFTACKQERQTCLTPRSAVLNVETMHIPSPGLALVDTVPPVPIFVPLATTPQPGILFPRTATFTLSLSPDANVASWAFITDTAAAADVTPDTLTFFYKRNLQFLSNACGYTYFYNIDSLQSTHHNIDSFKLLSTSVTNNVNTKHLQIYLHPNY